MLSRVILAGCVCAGLLAAAQGQVLRPGRDGPAAKGLKPELAPFTAEGTVQAVMRGRIQMLTDAAENWTVIIDPRAIVRVIGTAEPDYLRAGMFVRFTAEIEKGGMVQQKLRQLTIFAPSPENPPGLWPEAEAPTGDKPADGGPSLRGPADGGPRLRGPAGGGPIAGKAFVPGVYTVVGRITSFRKGRLTVNAGRAAVRADLAEDAQIDVDFADYSVARQGDKISVIKGTALAGRPGLAQAQELAVTLSQPLALPKKKPLRPKLPGTERSRPAPGKAGPEEKPLGEKPQDSAREATG